MKTGDLRKPLTVPEGPMLVWNIRLNSIGSKTEDLELGKLIAAWSSEPHLT